MCILNYDVPFDMRQGDHFIPNDTGDVWRNTFVASERIAGLEKHNQVV